MFRCQEKAYVSRIEAQTRLTNEQTRIEEVEVEVDAKMVNGERWEQNAFPGIDAEREKKVGRLS